MSDELICGKCEASCTCCEPEGHAGPHVCGVDDCHGQWEYDGERFVPVVFPTGGEVNIGNALAGMLRLLGWAMSGLVTLSKPEGGGEETAEQAMSRLAALVGSCEVEIVNPGDEGAEFFACELQDPVFFLIGNRRRHYGFGSGKTVLAAILAAEKTMDNLNLRPIPEGNPNDPL